MTPFDVVSTRLYNQKVEGATSRGMWFITRWPLIERESELLNFASFILMSAPIGPGCQN